MTLIRKPRDPGSLPQALLVQDQAPLGAYLRAVRKEQALRIDDAAALSGVSVDLMSRLENGASSIRLDKLLSVLSGLGLALVVAPKEDINDFLTGKEKMRAGRA